MRTLVFASVVTAALCASTASPAAQQKFEFVGPNQCLSCHDHDAERTWYEKKEIPEVQKLFPDRGNKAGHINSLQQLDDPKSDAFAKAIGLADVRTPRRRRSRPTKPTRPSRHRQPSRRPPRRRRRPSRRPPPCRPCVRRRGRARRSSPPDRRRRSSRRRHRPT
jgi:hypothetical protein